MLDNLRVRTVSDNLARSGFAQYAARVKARANHQREPCWSSHLGRERLEK